MTDLEQQLHGLSTPSGDRAGDRAGGPWWREAVVYQVYIRSFADGNGDGIGDIAGLRSRLTYLQELGVDAIWINPWYRSPMVDAGYDVEDYREIDPLFGSMADAEALIADCHALGIRVIVDLVPNHTSSRHAWFQAALAAAPGSPERARYWFRPGRGAEGELPPNDWRSRFGGSAWTRVTEADGSPGEWYLHLFAPEQPDLNWDHPEIAQEFLSILRFWLDRGVDGFRIDVAHGLVKDPALPDLGERAVREDEPGPPDTTDHPYWDRDELSDIYREWRRVADSYAGDRMFVAEAWVSDPHRLARYLDGDVLHTAFNFHFLDCAWAAPALRATIDETLAAHVRVHAPSTWVLSNHDVTRHRSRYGSRLAGALGDSGGLSEVDLALGERRARAAALLLLALPGSAYVYQGEELGLWEAPIPEQAIQDPEFARTGRTRDGCRVPMPWSGEVAPFGFSPAGSDVAAPWLPQPAEWASVSAEREAADADSMLALYRRALALRRSLRALGDGELSWALEAPEGVLAFTREPGFQLIVNLSEAPVPLPAGWRVLLASCELADGGTALPVDGAVWLEREL